MKITVPSGTNICKALSNVSAFFAQEAFADYPTLKGPMSIYLTLKGSSGKTCPENDTDYHITSTGVTDLLKEAQERALEYGICKLKARQTTLEKLSAKVINTLSEIDVQSDHYREVENNLVHVEEAISRIKKVLLSIEENDPDLQIYYRRLYEKNYYNYKVEAIFYMASLNGYLDEDGFHEGIPDEV